MHLRPVLNYTNFLAIAERIDKLTKVTFSMERNCFSDWRGMGWRVVAGGWFLAG